MYTLPIPARPDVDQYRKRAKDLARAANTGNQHALLARARSARVHHATLLHYGAANGVEDFRQQSTPNAVTVARRLLEAGAKVDALADTYDGGWWQTTMR